MKQQFLNLIRFVTDKDFRKRKRIYSLQQEIFHCELRIEKVRHDVSSMYQGSIQGVSLSAFDRESADTLITEIKQKKKRLQEKLKRFQK